MKLYGIAFCILLSSLCCKKTDMNLPANTSGKAYSYLALGDSYTIGQSVATTESYPFQLTGSLTKAGYSLKGLKVIAQTGWRTDNLRNAMNAAQLKDTFDIVSLLIGVNNQFQGGTVEKYRKEFRELLEEAIHLAKGRADKVFVLSIPDYGYTPFGAANKLTISKQLEIFNDINKEITDSLGVKYFNITPISQLAENDPSLLAPDELHPSGKMYKLWTEMMVEEVKKIVEF